MAPATTTVTTATIKALAVNTPFLTAISSPGVLGPVMILFALALIILILYLIVNALGKPMSFKVGPISVDLGGKKLLINKETKQETKYNSAFLIEKTKNLVEDSICKQKDIESDTIQKQLNVARERIIEINSIMTDSYANLLSTKLNIKNVKSHKEFRNYRIIIQMMTNEVVKERVLIKALKENHLSSKNGPVWSCFLESKVLVTLNLFSEYLDLMYYGTIISREDISRLNENTKKEVSRLIEEIYVSAKSISISDKNSIVQLKEETNIELEKLI